MKQLTENESVSLFVALAVVAATFYGVVGNPFVKTTPIDKQVDQKPIMIDATNNPEAASQALAAATDSSGTLSELVYEDVTVGTGREVKRGDTLVVNYIGRLQDGTEFDNSFVRGTPFTFTIGIGTVIPGWDQGIIGMKVGGERILLIPPALAYGSTGTGPIPPNATLLFSVSLVDIN